MRDPKLLDRILADFDTCGLVGERTNKLIGYLAAVSRKLDRPLAVVVQSSSAAGKSSLMDALLAFIPEEERIKYSAMTGQSLFYMGETNLKHKILAIVEGEGVRVRELCPETPAIGRRTHHRLDRQGPGDREPRDADTTSKVR